MRSASAREPFAWSTWALVAGIVACACALLPYPYANLVFTFAPTAAAVVLAIGALARKRERPRRAVIGLVLAIAAPLLAIGIAEMLVLM